MRVRRVVTGHNANGMSYVKINDFATNRTARRTGHESRLVWMTDNTPVTNEDKEDMGARNIGRPPPENGTIFRMIEIEPGVSADAHFTETIDYVIVISGEMDMELDTETIRLTAGDVIVQRGTRHNWVNNGSEPCRFAAILIDAKNMKRKESKNYGE